MRKLNYKVVKANREQTAFVFDNFYKTDKNKDIFIVFVAVADEDIIGYLVIEEKIIPPPSYGVNWWIWNIYTQPELRRQGIGSALLTEVIKQAEQEKIRSEN